MEEIVQLEKWADELPDGDQKAAILAAIFHMKIRSIQYIEGLFEE